ncbi:MAG: hypothetical protein U0930_03075 [Pirellulales bacterium]
MPSIRCPNCYQQVESERFDDHLADHQEIQADGQQKDYVTLPPEQRLFEELTSDRSNQASTNRICEYPSQSTVAATKSNGTLTIGAVLAALSIVGLLVLKKTPAAAMKQVAQGNNVQQRLEQEKAIQELNAKYLAQMRNGEKAPDSLPAVAGIDASEYKDKRKDLQAAASLQAAVQLENAKQFSRAVEEFDQLIEQNPNSPLYHNSKAWILATCSDDSVRDGKIAIEHATRACQLKMESPAYLDTLAAAYAEAGEFENALKTIDYAINLAKNKAQMQRFEARRALYEDRKPFRT